MSSRAGQPDTTFLTERRDFSQSRMREFRRRLQGLTELAELQGICIYATGSYARGEASEHSDIDLFFLHTGEPRSATVSRLKELRLFARVIEIGQEMNFPTFSNDGEFLKVLYIDEMLNLLGGKEDDFRNYFTARMLMLLESQPLANRRLYLETIDRIVDAYFRDYPDHATDFKPVFLINDIIRFWKTLCLNYEHRRNKPENDPERKRRQQVKNFKLKFSRLMTCFGTVVGICAMSRPITKSKIVTLTKKAPLDRFLAAATKLDELSVQCQEILDDYAWFLDFTRLDIDHLRALFEQKPRKKEMFRRADLFGERIYATLDILARKNNYGRYLVV